MTRVLLTGATGFIGRQALAPLAEAGHEVHAASTAPPAWGAGLAAWHTVDLLDAGAARALVDRVRPTHLLHLAWYAVPGLYWASTENFRWVQATLELLRAFHAAGGERVVAAGTCAEYRWEAPGVCVEGVTPLAPSTPYGACKAAVGELLAAYTQATGMPTAWGRIFHLYGPHEHPARLVSGVAGALLRGEEARCSSGEQVRDLLHVQDVADAFVALLGSGVTGAVNIGSGEPVALRDVVRALARHAGGTERVRLGALPTREGDPAVLVPDVARLREEVGWRPRVGLDEGLAATVAWWVERAGTPR